MLELAEALWRHEAAGVPALKNARDEASFLDQSETTQAKWIVYARVALNFRTASERPAATGELETLLLDLANDVLAEWGEVNMTRGVGGKLAAKARAALSTPTAPAGGDGIREATIEECAKRIEEVTGEGSVIALYVRDLSAFPRETNHD